MIGLMLFMKFRFRFMVGSGVRMLLKRIVVLSGIVLMGCKVILVVRFGVWMYFSMVLLVCRVWYLGM